MKYKVSKSLCVKSFLPASDYVINPYVGCVHGCKYCYASFISRFNGHTEDWGNYLEPKQYVNYDLPKDIAGKSVLIGSVTDAYNPAEAYFKLMPNILKALSTSNAHIEILTNAIKTWLFISPYFPGLTNIQEIIDISKGAVDYYGVENLNLRGKYRKTILDLIANYHPELIDLYKYVYGYKLGNESYWANVEKEVSTIANKTGVKIVNFMYHSKIKKH